MDWLINIDDGGRLVIMLVASHLCTMMIGIALAAHRMIHKMDDMVKDLRPLLKAPSTPHAEAARTILDYIADNFGCKIE